MQAPSDGQSAAALITEVPAPGALELAEQVKKSMIASIPYSEISASPKQGRKITVVGVGNVGMACAQTILTEDVADELALVDMQADKLKGEMMDLQHGAAFIERTKITADTDYAVTAGSDLCIVTAGARQRDGESRLSLVGRNVSILKSIIPQLVKHSPDTIIMMVSNPVDVLTWVAWKISGLPSNRVIGTGTNLDSSRFRFLLADALDVNTQNVHGYIIGEHGDSSVPLWSSVTVGGMSLESFLETRQIAHTKEQLAAIHRKVVDGAYDVIRLKGYTSWAIGYSVASLAKSILKNQRRIHPVSVLAQGLHGIEQEVFISLPALIGREGVLGAINAPLSTEEEAKLLESASTLWSVQKDLDMQGEV